MNWFKCLGLVIATSSSGLLAGMPDLPLFHFDGNPGSALFLSRSHLPGISGEPGLPRFSEERGNQTTLLCLELADTSDLYPEIHSHGCLPVPERSENMLVPINHDYVDQQSVNMLLPVSLIASDTFSDRDMDTGVIPLPCDQGSCIAWDYNGQVNVLELSDSTLEPETSATKAAWSAWEVVRTMDENGSIIYSWHDQSGHLHTLSEWEFLRRLSMYFQSLLELLYPEFFDSVLPAGGGWHRWQYKKVRKAADRPGNKGQQGWQRQRRMFRRTNTSPGAVVVAHSFPGRLSSGRQQKRHGNPPYKHPGTHKKESIDTLIAEFEAGGLQSIARRLGGEYHGKWHGNFCNRIKQVTNKRGALLDNDEKQRFVPFMEHLSTVVYSFDSIGLSTCVHSLTVSGLLYRGHKQVRESQQNLSRQLLKAIQRWAALPDQPSNRNAQAVSNLLLALVKLLEKASFKPELARRALIALLLKVPSHQADFIPQHVANLFWSQTKLVKAGLRDLPGKAMTALLPQVQKYQADFIPQHTAILLWALTELMEHKVLTPEQVREPVMVLMPLVEKHQAEFKSLEVCTLPRLLTALVDGGVIRAQQTRKAVKALLLLIQRHQAKLRLQEIVNLSLSLAKLVANGLLHPDLKDLVSGAVIALLLEVQKNRADFSSSQTYHLLWSLTKQVEFEVLELAPARAVVTELLPQLHKHQADFDPPLITSLLCLLAKLREYQALHVRQISGLLATLLRKVQKYQADFDFTPPQVASLLWALAKLMEHKVLVSEQAGEVVTALLSEGSQLHNPRAKFRSQETARLLWALAMFVDMLMENTFSNILGMVDIDVLESEQAQRIVLWALTVFLARGIDPGTVKSLMIPLHEALKNEQQRSLLPKMENTFRISGFWLGENLQKLPLQNYGSSFSQARDEQYRILKRIFPDHPLETDASISGFPPVNLLFRREKVVIEIQDSRHYLDRDNQVRMGSTILKIRTFEKLGFTVIEVPVSGVENAEVQKWLHEELLKLFSKTDDEAANNSCGSTASAGIR